MHEIVIIDRFDVPVYFADPENNIIYIKNSQFHFLIHGGHKIYDVHPEDLNQITKLRHSKYLANLIKYPWEKIYQLISYQVLQSSYLQ